MSDPRVGSSRDNSTSPGISRVIAGANSSSVATLLGTLIPVLIYVAIALTIFLVLRPRCERVYSPRTFLSSLQDHDRSPKLPPGWFKWIKPFWRMPESHILDHSSLDGFLFLRFLRILVVIAFVGCCLTWPVLLPLHATGGAGNNELDLFTMGNISDPRKYYAHALLAWLYFGFILYMVVRECIYSINLRQAYLMSPFYADRISSRTVLFTCVPQQYLYESRLRTIFGNGVKKVWLPRDAEALEDLVKERDQTAFRLERAETTLIKLANVARTKAMTSGTDVEPQMLTDEEEIARRRRSAEDFFKRPEDREPKTPTTSEIDEKLTLPDVSGSVASQWISHTARPHHRPLGNWGKRVDTIKWCRLRLKTLAWQIKKERRKLISRPTGYLPSVFIEFHTQKEAQIACQTLSHHRPLHMSQRYIGVRPYEIIWSSLSMAWWSKIVRKFTMMSSIVMLILFWALPCALVGIISNIGSLAHKFSFLHWILLLPSPILGLIEGLVPALALSALMSTVPWIVRACARVAGTPSLSTIEIYTQNYYFAFQVVQVFLVTTLSSAVSACLTQILENPSSAMTLLSSSLPTASNFYISYVLVQCLGLGSGALVQVFRLYYFQVVGKTSNDNRKTYERWHRLRRIHWGAIFPVFTNLGVIVISYSCMAPLILGFSTVGFCFIYLIYKYNLLYVYDSEIDTRGEHYPHALSHLLVGLYLAEICLIGIFAAQYAAGPVALMIALLIFTMLVHISLMGAIGPLLINLPVTLSFSDQDATTGPETSAITDDMLDEDEWGPFNEEDDEPDTTPEPGATRSLEGLPAGFKAVKVGLKSLMKTKIKSETDNAGLAETHSTILKSWKSWLSPQYDPHTTPNVFLKWLHPEVFSDYDILRRFVPDKSVLPVPLYPPEVERYVYYPPAMYSQAPVLWIPRDKAGVSSQEVKHSSKVVRISDEDGTMEVDAKGRCSLKMDISVTCYLRDREGRY